ncbi:ABC transporter ATP-binding protein [Massilia sp. TW-1]|uniref:ABC transporter ATP-binding protein n=1 Tax=Telluria antibiotica TaxID=2717319 RepID=A0ABX0PAI9_9BURK|nr:ABC transporter ATP-binding protein [Telluria antibiotica]NIA54323.1 ABC transporter ATP-binding protein [Telluria antibiotica]
MANVSLRKLNIVLGGKPIIRDLDLVVEPGEFLVLLGPSGCGKSTLLHSIAGLVDTDSGAVEIGGRDMTDADPSERGIGMVFQSYALYPTMTVEDNMSFGLRIAGTPKAEIRRRVDRAAAMLQLDALLRRKPAQLSGGQRQRVAIGRALVREAQVFLFDEPLSNLDAKLRAELRRELKLLHRTLGSTMIYVTHDQVEAMTLASRIVVMQAGEIQQIGTPLDVYERPANRFVAGFLGAPAMAFVDGVLDGAGRFRGDGIELACVPGSAAQAAVLGVRPEHVTIRADGPMTADVTLVEPMGNHHVVWLRCGAATLASLVHDGCRHEPGDRVAFAIDAARVSLFDPQTGNRL